MELANEDEEMQGCQSILEPLLKSNSATFTFESSKMVGYLRKYDKTTKTFGKNSHLRSVILDFKTALMIIKHDKDTTDTSKIKKIMFRDVESVECLDYMAALDNEFSYKFELKTTERAYMLSARTLHERSIWVAGIKYLIAMTSIMQNILKSSTTNAILDNSECNQQLQPKRAASEVPAQRPGRFADSSRNEPD